MLLFSKSETPQCANTNGVSIVSNLTGNQQ